MIDQQSLFSERSVCRACGREMPVGAFIGPGRPDAWLCENIEIEGHRELEHRYTCPDCREGAGRLRLAL